VPKRRFRWSRCDLDPLIRDSDAFLQAIMSPDVV
jgi:hypothetical protein